MCHDVPASMYEGRSKFSGLTTSVTLYELNQVAYKIECNKESLARFLKKKKFQKSSG